MAIVWIRYMGREWKHLEDIGKRIRRGKSTQNEKNLTHSEEVGEYQLAGRRRQAELDLALFWGLGGKNLWVLHGPLARD